MARRSTNRRGWRLAQLGTLYLVCQARGGKSPQLPQAHAGHQDHCHQDQEQPRGRLQ